MNTAHGYKKLKVWTKSMILVEEIYIITSFFPKNETYGLTSQIRRSAVSIPSNIAEGYRRHNIKEYKNFLKYSYSSGAELETQIIISKKLTFGRIVNFDKAEGLLDEVMKMLNVLLYKVYKND